MPAKFFWFLPTNGDSRSIVGASHASSHHTVPANYRAPTRRYLAEVARAADRLGYEGVLDPHRNLVRGRLADRVGAAGGDRAAEVPRRVPARAWCRRRLAAQQTATLQRFSEGRVLLNIVSGGDDIEQQRFGDWLGHDERYARTGEFLHIVNSVWRAGIRGLRGQVLHGQGRAGVGAAGPVAADLFRRLVARRPSDRRRVRRRLSDVGRAARRPRPPRSRRCASWPQTRGRNVRFGIRLHTISRDTSAAAWAVADELLAELTPEQIAKATELHAKSESEGQRRMTALHGGRIDQLEIYPNLWAGVGLVRGGAGTALVGSHEEVANLIYEYHSVGFDEFILSGYPHLEEAYWFAEGVLPLLRQKGVA